MTQQHLKGGSGRPVDADLKFWSATAKLLAGRPGRMAEIRSNFMFFIVTIFVTYIGWCVWDRFKGEKPSDVTKITVENSPVQVGGKLRVRIAVDRHRICEREFQWIISDHTGKRERFQEAPMHGIGNAGPDEFLQEFVVPSDLDPGPAKLRIIWSWQCPENLYEAVYPVVLIPPEIKFDIAPKPEG